MIFKNKTYTFLLFTALMMLVISCVEEYDVQTEVFESALVVEAIITDEDKHHTITLSRTYRFEEDGPVPETNAQVKVVSNDGNEYLFIENPDGKYISELSFSADQNETYFLEIITSDGRTYKSYEAQISQQSHIDNLVFERNFNENGEEGVSVLIDTYDPTGESKYYRFEYEETYKIIAPNWTSLDLVIGDTSMDEPLFMFENRPIEELICYQTNKLNTINIVNTNDYFEDRLEGYRVHFVNRNNYIISHRYSALVRMYVQSREAYVFYKTLKEFSDSESIFSQSQTGFFEGNVFSTTNSSENVIGFFDVSSVDEQRIYFNYEDLFAEEVLPPYQNSCTLIAAPADVAPAPGASIPLVTYLQSGDWKYLRFNDDIEGEEGPYDLILRPCGDCTALGNSEAPDFWIE